MIRRPPRSTLFPYTTSSDLLASPTWVAGIYEPPPFTEAIADPISSDRTVILPSGPRPRSPANVTAPRDRKSTRLNSSHSQISYAVFCLKKKKTQTTYPHHTQ